MFIAVEMHFLLAVLTAGLAADNQCPVEGEFFPNPEDCSAYYECINGTKVMKLCPLGNEFNPRELLCQYPSVAKCRETTTNLPATTSPYECLFDGQLLPNPYDCSSYFECSEGLKILRLCPQGQEFNSEEKLCQFPSIAKCRVSEATSTQIPDPSACSVEGDLFPNPENCNTYLLCRSGRKVVMKCPHGQDFNPTEKLCQFPSIAKCQATSSTTTEWVFPPECDNEGELFPNPDDCATFFVCIGHNLMLEGCPDGLLWNQGKKVCDWPENVKCPITDLLRYAMTK